MHLISFDYTKLCLLELTDRIVRIPDLNALQELHEHRPLFCHKDGQSLLLVEYVDLLKQDKHPRLWCSLDSLVLEMAYDLTMSKFYNIPSTCSESECAVVNDKQSEGTDGIDCRYYFQAFLNYATSKFKSRPPAGTGQTELMAAEMLQKMVKRHFYFSCLESRRRAQKLTKRYAWKINDYTLTVWLPSDMPGSRCRSWLEENIPNVNPKQPGERDRVQAIIDQLLPRRKVLSLEDIGEKGDEIVATGCPIPSLIERQITIAGLAQVVATEKADNIESQRPRIRQLGSDKLKQLIHGVFEQLDCEEYREAELAASFGLSKATFSRFAGSRWSSPADSSQTVTVPDLWRNTAHTLANHSDFVEAAQQAGVWKKVKQVLDTDT